MRIGVCQIDVGQIAILGGQPTKTRHSNDKKNKSRDQGSKGVYVFSATSLELERKVFASKKY